ncbi:hypothetical protein D3C87_1893190 [compost metagenome]
MRKYGQDIPFPVDDIFSAEIKYALKRIPEHYGRQYARHRRENAVLASIAVLIFVNENKGIRRAHHAIERGGA